MTFLEQNILHTIGNIVPQELLLNKLRTDVDAFLENKQLTPPLSEDQLYTLAEEFIEQNTTYESFLKLLIILINNFTWRKYVQSIPFERRILLLPKCFQNTQKCEAKTDELGLICEFCGNCKLNDYIKTAEKLGYHVVVSEGSGAVSVLLQTGQIECVIGVACIESFERTFSISLEQAIPSIAIPLYNGNCKDSKTNEEWLLNEIKTINNAAPITRVNLKTLSQQLNQILNSTVQTAYPIKNETTTIANNWLLAGGKRWRPLILLAVNEILATPHATSNSNINKLALAIESFHKASLAHDDIADNDKERYGEKSLFNNQSMAITLNSGDLLLSYGYQLIADSNFEPETALKLLAAASRAHHELCIGQGEELIFKQNATLPTSAEVIEIFSKKTAPAFRIPLNFASIINKKDNALNAIIEEYSYHLGIAYQIKDDISDFEIETINNDINDGRLSIILSLLNEALNGRVNDIMLDSNTKNNVTTLYNLALEHNIIDRAEQLIAEHKKQAFSSLSQLSNVSLKIFLFQLINKILG